MDPVPGGQHEVMLTMAAHIQVGLEFLSENGFFALGTFRECALSNHPFFGSTGNGLGLFQHRLIRGGGRRGYHRLLAFHSRNTSGKKLCFVLIALFRTFAHFYRYEILRIHDRFRPASRIKFPSPWPRSEPRLPGRPLSAGPSRMRWW